MKSTAILRQRGQLTIPDDVRDQFDWLRTNAVVEFDTKPPHEIVLRPFSARKDQPDWDAIWRNIALTRSFKSKRGPRKSLSQFIIEDRQNH